MMVNPSPDPQQRRPLKVRQTRWVHAIAQYLVQRSISPNQISLLSIVCAAVVALLFLALPHTQGLGQFAIYLLAALGIQARLLCNLFDGLVAVEGKKATASGELFNDIPDRIADPLIIVAAGYAVMSVTYADTLGWCAALLAVLTAYVRTLAVSIDAPANFTGPMAKQHRMALLTIACVLTALEQLFWQHDYLLLIALMVMILGCVITLWRRISAAYRYLENKTGAEE